MDRGGARRRGGPDLARWDSDRDGGGSRSSVHEIYTNGALYTGAPLVVLQKNIIVVAHYEAGAPLLVRTSNGALCPGAPLVCLEK